MRLTLPVLLAVAAACIFAGCATHTKQQLAAVRTANVSPSLLKKLEHHGSLTPEDLIELKRRHVDDSIALRQLDRDGVDYVLDKAAVKKMQAAGVSEPVIRTAVMAGRRFAARYYEPDPAFAYGWYPWYGPWGYPYSPYFRDPWWPYGPGYIYPRHFHR